MSILSLDERLALSARLAEPFAADEVRWRPGAARGDRAMAIAYIDARAVMDRLDDVLGVGNWYAAHEIQSDGTCVCRLSVRVGGEWVTHEDRGDESEQPDDGDRAKAAYSDSLKRAAVRVGVGRYLYRLPQQWVGYDPQKKRLTETPKLPAWALPADKKPAAPPAPGPQKDAPPADNGQARSVAERIRAFDAKLIGENLCQPGELADWLRQSPLAREHGPDFDRWPLSAVAEAQKLCKRFEAECRDALPLTPDQFAVIDELVGTKGVAWATAAEENDIPRNMRLSEISRAQARGVIKWLESLDDKPATGDDE